METSETATRTQASEPDEATIACGRHLARHADLAGSRFIDVNLAKARFENVNLAGATFENVNLGGSRFHDINLGDARIEATHLGGVSFCCIGPPPDASGRQARQRPTSFQNAMLCDSTFRNVDLSNVSIVECRLDGMTIDGILVTELLEAYREVNGG